MPGVLASLGLTVPVLAAPMAGGPTTPNLVVAAGQAGGLGQLAGGYLTAEMLGRQIAEVRGVAVAFGVNLFAPNPVPVDRDEYRRYARALRADAARYGLRLDATEPIEDDDHWEEKLDLLLSEPVPLVSFTFNVPSPAVVSAFRSAGTCVAQTVTSAAEADRAVTAGTDVLIVQGSAAGGHSGTFTPDRTPPNTSLVDLLRQVAAVTDRPLIAAGGVATAEAVAGALRAGASAVSVGTALLRSEESGASAPYKAALADPARVETIVTRAFSGRPARALRNGFTDRYHHMAPVGYPAVHHLTRPLRRAAAAEGNAELINLWAGTGHGYATDEPVAHILSRLTAEL